MILSWILKFLTGGILEKLLDTYSKRQDVNGVIAVESIKAEIATRQLQAAVILNESGWAVSRWMRPFVFYPLALHLNLVILDSIFHFPFDIARLPDPMNQWQGAIILSFFLVRPLEKALGYFKA